MASEFRRRCWLEWAILGFGLPALIAGASRLVAAVAPASQHGTLGQRYILSLVGGVIAEWVFVLAAWLFLNRRNESFRDLGAWRLGNWAGWSFALLFAGLSIAGNLRFLPGMGVPLSYAFAPHGFHLVAALATGITAGFCEEILFHGLLMTDFARAGYGKVVQVILPGASFGFSYLGYSVHGFVAAVGIMAPTAILGMMWGIAYLLGRRGLVPCFVAHFLNDSTALAVLDRLNAGDTALVPAFWSAEVLNSLLIGEKRGRISLEQTRAFLRDLAALRPIFDNASVEQVFGSVQKLCREHKFDAIRCALC